MTFAPFARHAPSIVARPLADRAVDPKAARHDLREPSGEAIDAQLLRIRDMHVAPLVFRIDGRQDRSELTYWPQRVLGGAVGQAAT